MDGQRRQRQQRSLEQPARSPWRRRLSAPQALDTVTSSLACGKTIPPSGQAASVRRPSSLFFPSKHPEAA
uniref:Uncharacterized protein n=1 Tax=Oryza meridionalis TaxID=40149 RepID=A0A0E0F422_9ORYZ